MDWLLQRRFLESAYGWLVSAVIHLTVLLAVALTLTPIAGDLWNPIEVQVALEDLENPGQEEVAWLESVAMPAIPAELPQSGAIDNGQLPSLEIAGPDTLFGSGPSIDSLARGANGSGTDLVHASLKQGLGGEFGGVSFFGTYANGNRFVYVVDVSPSMNARNGKRIERALTELLESIDKLNSDQDFYVIVFGGQARMMFDEIGLNPQMIPATLANKRRLRDWLATLSTIGSTDPREALRIGLAMSPSALFLLSDGEFNPDTVPRRLLGRMRDMSVNEVVEQSNVHSIPIHTIAFEDESSEKYMKEVAEKTQGSHRFVPPPDGKKPPRNHAYPDRSFRGIVSDFKFQGE